MASIKVTLDVSNASGWLNADAYCRESNGGHTVRGKVQASRRGRRRPARAVEARLQMGDRTGVERTRNMAYMLVTLEVSQLETSASKFFK